MSSRAVQWAIAAVAAFPSFGLAQAAPPKPVPPAKPPAATVSMAEDFAARAKGAGRVLYQTWHSREAAAEANGMTRQTLRDWVHRFNADGVTGLRSRTSPGRPPALNETRREELKTIVLEGPDPERHRVVRWRRIDLCEEIAARWSVTVCEQTMGKWLRQLGMTRLQPRPYHPKKDLEAEVAFKKTSLAW